MTFLDPNITYSKQMCDIAVGGYLGIGGILYVLWKIALLCLGFYAIYKITKLFIDAYKIKKYYCKKCPKK